MQYLGLPSQKPFHNADLHVHDRLKKLPLAWQPNCLFLTLATHIWHHVLIKCLVCSTAETACSNLG